MCVFPTSVAPASSIASTAAAFEEAGVDPEVSSQRGEPQPVRTPATSRLSFAENVSPERGPPGAPSRAAKTPQ